MTPHEWLTRKLWRSHAGDAHRPGGQPHRLSKNASKKFGDRRRRTSLLWGLPPQRSSQTLLWKLWTPSPAAACFVGWNNYRRRHRVRCINIIRRAMKNRTCWGCGENFIPRVKAKHCSHECRRKGYPAGWENPERSDPEKRKRIVTSMRAAQRARRAATKNWRNIWPSRVGNRSISTLDISRYDCPRHVRQRVHRRQLQRRGYFTTEGATAYSSFTERWKLKSS